LKAGESLATPPPDVMRELVRLALSAEDERVRSVCAVAVLDRAGVRPIDVDPNEGRTRVSSSTHATIALSSSTRSRRR
jgi:hypothetical protein